MRALSVICLALAVVLAALGMLFSSALRFDLIIALGIVAADSTTTACFAGAALLAVAGVALIVIQLSRRMRARSNQQAAFVPSYASLSDDQRRDPAVILRELQYIRPARPTLDAEIAAAIDCLNQADSKQAKIHELQQMNPSRNLDQVVRTIDDAELAIAANTTKILNMLTIWDPAEATRPEKAQIYSMNREYIHTNLQKNRQITDQADMLLHTVVKYIGSSGSEDAMSDKIDSLNKALASLLGEYQEFSAELGKANSL
jgi:hypothetical protein